MPAIRNYRCTAGSFRCVWAGPQEYLHSVKKWIRIGKSHLLLVILLQWQTVIRSTVLRPSLTDIRAEPQSYMHSSILHLNHILLVPQIRRQPVPIDIQLPDARELGLTLTYHQRSHWTKSTHVQPIPNFKRYSTLYELLSRTHTLHGMVTYIPIIFIDTFTTLHILTP